MSDQPPTADARGQLALKLGFIRGVLEATAMRKVSHEAVAEARVELEAVLRLLGFRPLESTDDA